MCSNTIKKTHVRIRQCTDSCWTAISNPVRFGTSRVQWQSHGSWSSMIGQWNMQSAVSWICAAMRASKSRFLAKKLAGEKTASSDNEKCWVVKLFVEKRGKPWLHHINSQFKSASAVIRWSQQDVAALPAWPVCPALSAATVLVELKIWGYDALIIDYLLVIYCIQLNRCATICLLASHWLTESLRITNIINIYNIIYIYM